MALHISNGIVNAPVSAAFGALAVVALAICISRARTDLDDRLAPMAGLVAAFIFAVQMLNFQVLPGVSGHLLGRRARGHAGRAVGRRTLRLDRARRAMPTPRRRRPDRAGPEHHQHGTARHRRRLRAHRAAAEGAAEDPGRSRHHRVRGLGGQRDDRVSRLRAGVLPRRHDPDLDRYGRSRDGRRAHADRHR